MIAGLLALKKHSGFIRYFKNTSWMMVEQMLRIVAGLFVGVWVARYLGPVQFGLLSFVMAFAAIFGGIAKLGLDSILVRELVSHPEKRELYLGTAFWLKIIASIALLICAIPVMVISGNEPRTILFLCIILSGSIFQSFDVIQFYFQSQVLAKTISICKVYQLIISSISKIFLVLADVDLIWFVFAAALDIIILSISYLFAYRKKEKLYFFANFDKTIAKKIGKDGFPLMIAGLGFSLFSNVDVIMIKGILNESAAGIYSAAYRLTILWHFLPGLILTSFMPAMINVKKNPLIFDRRIEIITGILFWFAIVLALTTTLLADFIVDLLYGLEYSNSSDLLIILIWLNVIVFFNSCWNYVHILHNKVKWVMYFHLSTALLSIIFNLLFIPIFGVAGAAYSILASLISSMIFFSFIDKNMLPLLYHSIIFWRRL